MAWVLLAFDKGTEQLATMVPLPDRVDDEVVRPLVGEDVPVLRGVSFAMEADRLRRLAHELGLEIRDDQFDYFIEYLRDER
jgi:hypothetical protein